MRAAGESFDLAVMQLVAWHRTGWADAVAQGVMWVGTTPWVLLVGALAVAVGTVLLRAYRPVVTAAVAAATAAAGAAVLKQVFDRPRPPAGLALVHALGPSFPSTHAMVTSALAAAVLVTAAWRTATVTRTAAALLVAAVGLVGVCMVYLGAHWPTDVLAGWVLGALLGATLGRVGRRVGPRPRTVSRERGPLRGR